MAGDVIRPPIWRQIAGRVLVDYPRDQTRDRVELRSTGPNRWADGWLYNPEDGKTYNISAELRSADVLVARIYLGLPLFGQTKVLHRVLRGTSEGWC